MLTGAWGSAFLVSSQVMPVLLVQGPHFEWWGTLRGESGMHTVEIPQCPIFASFPFSRAIWGWWSQAPSLSCYPHFRWDHKQRLPRACLISLTPLPSWAPSWAWIVTVLLSPRVKEGPHRLPSSCSPTVVPILHNPELYTELTPTLPCDVFWDHDILKHLRANLESSYFGSMELWCLGRWGYKALKELGKTRDACDLQVEEMTSSYLAGVERLCP